MTGMHLTSHPSPPSPNLSVKSLPLHPSLLHRHSSHQAVRISPEPIVAVDGSSLSEQAPPPPPPPPAYHPSAPPSVYLSSSSLHYHSCSASLPTAVLSSPYLDLENCEGDTLLLPRKAPIFTKEIAGGESQPSVPYQQYLEHLRQYQESAESVVPAMSHSPPYQDAPPVPHGANGRGGYTGGFHVSPYGTSSPASPLQHYSALAGSAQPYQNQFSPLPQHHLHLQPQQHAYHHHPYSVPGHFSGAGEGQLSAAAQRRYASNVNPDGTTGGAPVIGSNDARSTMRCVGGLANPSPALSYNSLPASPHSHSSQLGTNFGRLPNGSIIELFPAMMRTLQACEYCRSRKAKCTGGLPCERCTKKKVRCEYAQLDKKRKVKTTTSHLDLSGVGTSASQQHHHQQHQQQMHKQKTTGSSFNGRGIYEHIGRGSSNDTFSNGHKRNASHMSSSDCGSASKKTFKTENTFEEAKILPELLPDISAHACGPREESDNREKATVEEHDNHGTNTVLQSLQSMPPNGAGMVFPCSSAQAGSLFAGTPSSTKSLPQRLLEFPAGFAVSPPLSIERSEAFFQEESFTPTSTPSSPPPNADGIATSSHRVASGRNNVNDTIPLLWQTIYGTSSQASTSTASHPPSPLEDGLPWATDSFFPSFNPVLAPCSAARSPGSSQQSLPFQRSTI